MWITICTCYKYVNYHLYMFCCEKIIYSVCRWQQDLCRSVGNLVTLCDFRIQGSFLAIWQGRRWHNHNERVGHSDEVSRSESNGSWASRHDQRSRRWRYVARWKYAYIYTCMYSIICQGSKLTFWGSGPPDHQPWEYGGGPASNLVVRKIMQ